ncbi:MAG TPA: hypothetical protein VM869_35455 [Enhygromyxa sp.]|nr:hypothetical protein [Enhygromyxa sp.]
MQLAALESRIDELVLELRQYNGHRTVWLSEVGELIHSEPDDMLEVRGFAYITTMFRPTRDELTCAVLKHVPVELDEPIRRAMARWERPSLAIESSLAPAM